MAGLGARPGPAGASTAPESRGFCENIDLPWPCGRTQGLTQKVSGTYCEPRSWAGGPHEVDVLTPGATYNRLYWDWPVDPELYSYVDKTLAAGPGDVRLRPDRDRSEQPSASVEITIDTDAYVLHQIVTWLRSRSATAR